MAGINNRNATSLNDSLKALIEQHGYGSCKAALQQYSTKDDESVALMESILDASLDAGFVADESGSIQRVNQAAVDQFGFQHKQELVGQHLSQVVLQLLPEESTTTMSRLEQQQNLTAKRADGSQFLVQVGLQRVQNTFLWVVFCHDLTRHQRKMPLIEKEQQVNHEKELQTCAVYNASSDACIVCTDKGIIRRVNNAAGVQFGYADKYEMVGKHITTFFYPEHATCFELATPEGFDEIMESLQDIPAKRKDGSEFSVQVHMSLVKETTESDGESLLVVAYCHDLTRHKTQMATIGTQIEAFEAEQRMMYAILDASFDSCFVTDHVGTIRRVNQMATTVFGYPRKSDFIGKNIDMIIGGPRSGLHSQYFQKTYSQEELDGILDRMRDVVAKRRDGSEFHVQIGVRLVETSTEKFFVAYCHDLTLHRTQRQSIQVQQQSIEIQKTTIQEKDDINKSILDSSFDAIIVCNDNGIIQQINQTTLDEFGYSEMSDLVGENLSLLVGDNHASDHDMYMERFRKAGKTSSILGQNREVYGSRKDGSQFPCRIGIKKVPNTSLLVGFVHDITHEKKAIALSIEKRAAEELLHNMLPESIAIRLKKDPNHIAEHFTRATILFADIVGFTSMSSKLRPIQVVTFLNDIFSRFDARLDRYGLNKVKTIGDCYMVTSIPGSREPDKACTAVCYFAMDMIREIEDYNIRNPEQPLNMRIGVNLGPVVAGVVGTKRFLYDIWGDAVNIASRMESTGVAGKVQVTKSVIDAVPEEDFGHEKRGSVAVKGIGELETFFLIERDDSQASRHWSKPRLSYADKRLLTKLSSLELLQTPDQLEPA